MFFKSNLQQLKYLSIGSCYLFTQDYWQYLSVDQLWKITEHSLFQYIYIQKSLIMNISSKFQEAIIAPGFSLKQFYRKAAQDLFPQATYHPDVLKYSASCGDRFIKQFMNNPHANLRIFYFQLLRLCYYPNLTHTLGFINNMKKVILNPDFIILFSFDTQEKSSLFNNLQFKKLFCEFLDLLDYKENPCIQNSLNDYPIIDIVMIHIMRSLLANKNINPQFHCKIDTNLAFSQLSSIFKLQLSSFQNYWVFQDSDFVVYAESQWELFASYKEVQEVQNNIRRTKYINKLILGGSVQTPVISKNNKQKLFERKKRSQILSPSSIMNVASPKNGGTHKMIMSPFNFTRDKCFTKNKSSKFLHENQKMSLQNQPDIKKTNPESMSNKENQDFRQSKLQKIGSQNDSKEINNVLIPSRHFFLKNKENQNQLQNIKFNETRQARSKSFKKGVQIWKIPKLFKK